MLSIGIDFGTSNSSVAVFDGARVRLLAIDRHARNPQVMRSLLYIPRDGDIVAGQRALDLYTEQNTGREVKLERYSLGEIEMTFSDMTVIKEAFAMIDVNEPGRLFQSLKRFLAVTSFKRTNVFGRDYRLEELVATLARQMLLAAEGALDQRIDRLVVGRPVHFSEDAAKDEAARERLAEAWSIAGVSQVRFLEEPVAAAKHYAAVVQLAPGSRTIVFDFGGGTLDVSLVHATSGGAEVPATGGVPIGGDLMDSRIMETRIARRFGRGARYQTDDLPVPSHIFSRLRSWQTIVELNRPQQLEIIHKAQREADQPRELAALEALVTRNYGLALFRAIEEAKIALSTEEDATVRLHHDPIDLDEPLSREEFEATIGPQIHAARQCTLGVVRSAGCEPEQIDVVLTTGGSSLIPAFRRMLADALPNATLTEADTFTSVAAGLALAGAEGW